MAVQHHPYHRPWSGTIGEELLPAQGTVDECYTNLGPTDGTPLAGMGAPSVRRALREWVERQRRLGLSAAFIHASATLLDLMVRFFATWRGSFAADTMSLFVLDEDMHVMLQNRLKKGVPHLYRGVVESPLYRSPDDSPT